MTKKLLKIKGPDGKWLTLASYEEGMYGPRVGIHAPTLRKVLEAEGWVNFSVYDDDREKPAPKAEPAAKTWRTPDDDPDLVPF